MTQPIEKTLPAGSETAAFSLWLSTPDTQYYYTEIQVVPRDTTGTDESDWVILAPDDGGSPGVFLAPGAPLDCGSAVVDDENSIRFWVKFAVPSGAGAQVKTDIKLGKDYTKHAVV